MIELGTTIKDISYSFIEPAHGGGAFNGIRFYIKESEVDLRELVSCSTRTLLSRTMYKQQGRTPPQLAQITGHACVIADRMYRKEWNID